MLTASPRSNNDDLLKILLTLTIVVFIFGLTQLASQLLRASNGETSSAATNHAGNIIIDSGATPNQNELDAAAYLADKGHKVRLLPRDPSSTQPQPDAQLDDDDFPTEIKTVGDISSDNIPARLAGRIREGLGQAPSVFVDARKQAGLTEDQITEAMRRAIGMARDANRIVRRLHIVGPNGTDVLWDYPNVSVK